MDTTRADHCSVYGYERDTTPNLRAFADQGTRFDLAYSPTSITAPSHATIFTGLYPQTHRVLKNGIQLSETFSTLAEMLGDLGYQTAAVVGSFAMAGKFGFEQGFSHYEDDFAPERSTYEMETWQGYAVEGGFDRRADETSRRAVNWLQETRNVDQPFFLFVHFFDPHDPYDPPKQHERQLDIPDPDFERWNENRRYSMIAKYDAEIAFTDFEIGKVLATLSELGLEEDTIVIVTGDHGEGLMNHGYLTHAVHIYEEQVRVPLLMRWPEKIASGRILSGPIEMVDIAPTIMDLIGGDSADTVFHGRSLVPALAINNPESLDPERPVFLYRQHFRDGTNEWLDVKGEKYGVRKGRWKFIVGLEENTLELFDLEDDPGETVNLAAERPIEVENLTRQIREWQEKYDTGGELDFRSEADLERLKALGYVD